MLMLRADVAIDHASSLRWRQPKQSNGMESFMILASHTVDCHETSASRNDKMFRLRLNMTTHPLTPSAREGE